MSRNCGEIATTATQLDESRVGYPDPVPTLHDPGSPYPPDAPGFNGMTQQTPWEPPRFPQRHFAVLGEPNDWTFRALATVLEPDGFELIQARSSDELLDHVNSIGPDLVLVSDVLPDLSAPEVCTLLRAHPSFNPATPILVTSSELIDETAHMKNLRAGAWDTIRLPANAEEFRLKIARFVGAKTLSDVARDERMLDGVSGFYNLNGLLRRAEEEAAEANRFQRALACVVFGPAIPASKEGDPEITDEMVRTSPELEAGLERIFRRMGRRSDVIGRLNPNEFIVVAPSTDEEGALKLSRRMLAEMQGLTIPSSTGRTEVEMHAGYFAPSTHAPAAMKPSQLVGRAAGALRRSQSRHLPGETISAWQGESLDIEWESGEGQGAEA
ncbi:hypothetical protein BH23GEM11_BH23GEM11_12990 [soil metagenome]